MRMRPWGTLIGTVLLAVLPTAALAQRGGMGGGMSGGGMSGGSMSMPGGGMGMGFSRDPGMHAMDARRHRAEAMQRSHRDVLDLDPAGNVVVRDEVVAVGFSPSTLGAARAAGFAIVRQGAVDGLDFDLAVLAPPKGMSLRKAVKRLAELDPTAAIDYNHLYLDSSSQTPEDARNAGDGPTAERSDAAQRALVRIGLIDGGIAPRHPSLRSLTLHTFGCDGVSIPSAHGTAVASRLVAGFGASPPPAIDLFAVDAYCGTPTGGSAEALVRGIGWLVKRGVPVVNISLVGPPNASVQRAVASAVDRGHLLVAAVGNDGPAAPAQFPAAYPGVVAVTGVDRKGHVLLEAGRSPHLAFAAPGADIQAAQLPDGATTVRGTSFAAPVVASQLALRIDRADQRAAARALRELADAVTRPGKPPNPAYGFGCVSCEPAEFAPAGH